MRPAGVRVVRAHAIVHLPGAFRLAAAPAGVRIPHRCSAPALRIGRLADDATLEDDFGPVFVYVIAGGRRRDQTAYEQKHGSEDFHRLKQTMPATPRRGGAVDVVGGEVPPDWPPVLVLARHEHS